MSEYLDCPECGDAAVESEDGLFGEEHSGPCMSCGVVGSVRVGEDDEGNLRAEWEVSE